MLNYTKELPLKDTGELPQLPLKDTGELPQLPLKDDVNRRIIEI